ncbi:MAG: class 1 isoprenoid biosynthesis enzyme [Vicinamibacterales bacterium]
MFTVTAVTLSPVFRSEAAIEALRAEGVWDRMQEASVAQRNAVQRVRADLPHVLDGRFLRDAPGAGAEGAVPLEFVQEFFFLIFFRSVLESAGVQRGALDLYSELNFCIKGTITAADNLFDDQQKALLPLVASAGPRFSSILQLIAFQRLTQRVFDRGIHAALVSARDADRIQRELLSRMAAIGMLEGSEEEGVEDVLEVDEMVERVHRVRGGALFELGFVAPACLEGPELQGTMARVEKAISRLGTAFQMVDDLTDVEFDVGHGRQNLLVAQVHHHGNPDERAALLRVRESRTAPKGVVETLFLESARAVLDRAHVEARGSLDELHALGFWFPPALSDQLVRAIVGLDGVTMMKALTR